jgi:putative transposase
MARPLRLEYKGAFYHVTSRGNERRKIYYSETDYRKFEEYLREAKKKYGFLLHGYVLMGNHYHLLVETPEANLGKVMHYLNGAYTIYINIKRKRSGHLFQGRYKAIVVDQDSYLLELSRYIHLNPVRAGIVQKPEDYPHSSCRTYLSSDNNNLVTRELVWQMVGAGNNNGVSQYRSFMENGLSGSLENPIKKIYAGIILGGQDFIQETLKRIRDDEREKEEVSHRKQLKPACGSAQILGIVAKKCGLSVEKMLRGQGTEAKKIAIYLMKKHTGMTNQVIGEQMGRLSYSAVTKVCQRLVGELNTNHELRIKVDLLEREMSNVKG